MLDENLKLRIKATVPYRAPNPALIEWDYCRYEGIPSED
jgi:hypothetical protein